MKIGLIYVNILTNGETTEGVWSPSSQTSINSGKDNQFPNFCAVATFLFMATRVVSGPRYPLSARCLSTKPPHVVGTPWVTPWVGSNGKPIPPPRNRINLQPSKNSDFLSHEIYWYIKSLYNIYLISVRLVGMKRLYHRKNNTNCLLCMLSHYVTWRSWSLKSPA